MKNPSQRILEAPGEGILHLHSAIDHDGLWKGVRLLLREAFRFRRITLFLGHLGMAEARVVFTDPPIEESRAWYRERARLNPFSPFIEKNIGRDCYHFHEVVGPPETFRKTPFYQQFARREGWDKGISVMFWTGDEMRAMFSLYRGPKDPDFSASERQNLLSLARHIEIAVVRVQKINREENFRSALQAFSRTIPAPLILLDWLLNPVFINLAAYESVAVWNLGRLKARSVNPREYFRTPPPIVHAVGELKRKFMERSDADHRRRLPDPVDVAHPSIHGLRARVQPAHYAPSTLARPGFVVHFTEPLEISGDEESADYAKYRARALQELTPAERKVVAEVCKGKRNEEIATVLNKSILTVKTQLNSVYQKLDIRSRSELIVRMRPQA